MSSTASSTTTPTSASTGTALTDLSPLAHRNTSVPVDNEDWDFAGSRPQSVLMLDWQPSTVAELESARSAFWNVLDRFHPHHDERNSFTVNGGSPNTGVDQESMKPTCFIFIKGSQDIFDYERGGRFADIRTFDSFLNLHSRDRGKEIFLFYLDKRDAVKAMNVFRYYSGYSEVMAQFINVDVYCHSTRDLLRPIIPSELGQTFETEYPGEVFVIVSPRHKMSFKGIARTFVGDKVRDVIEPQAAIEKFTEIFAEDPGHMYFRVALFEPRKADEVVTRFQDNASNFISDALTFECFLYRGINNLPDGKLDGDSNHYEPQSDTDVLGPATATNAGVFGAVGSSRPSVGTNAGVSPVARNERSSHLNHGVGQNLFSSMSSSATSGQPVDDNYVATPSRAPTMGSVNTSGRMLMMTPEDRLELARLERLARTDYFNNFDLPANRRDQKNVIDVDMIYAGQDVRTTVMLRNIPNRVTHEMLRLILNSTLWGCYDFVYLRIDFTNNCNVGYAFINFVHPQHVAKFVEDVAGQKWRHSDKVAEVSYATMQGRETLVQKFRNSSVMMEAAESRPKLYYSSTQPKAGEEEEFPEPDNLFKLARSNQNAAHIGLFSPARGGVSVARMHRMHGRYDRGTSFALLERMMAENAMLRSMRGSFMGREDNSH